MLDLALLGLLQEGPLHGYELRKRLRNQFGLLANVSFGSVYPALSRLEKAGAVEAAELPPPVALTPPTGSLTGEWAAARLRRRGTPAGRRSKKVYRITPLGRQFFLSRLTDLSSDDARSFSLRLALARHMDPQDRLGLLERRRSQLLSQLEDVPDPASQPDEYARSVTEHIVEGVEQDIAWLDRLIEAERAQGTAPAVTTTGGRPSRRTA